MKILRYLAENSTPAFGCLEGDVVHQLLGDPLRNLRKGERVGLLSDVQLLAPCEPTKVVCMAINFPGIGGYSKSMSEPLVFVKPATCVSAPGVDIVNPFSALPWWGEAELAVVIRQKLRNATEQQVLNGIVGFTIGNDVTVENVEGRDHHLARSKCPDSFCPIGPWIDTQFDARDCLIEAVQNGEVIRRGQSSDHVWQWPRIVAWLTTWMTLEPWDVILTGNPPDTVGMRFLQDGDTYTARIHGLGELTNKFYTKGVSNNG
jgi:2-keto-4-pentenoate hydratase/2-oxohepta-3-ene-1,7-dioic acid hydratase in catechol pathway